MEHTIDGGEHPQNGIRLLVTMLLVMLGHLFETFKSNDPLIEFITWIAQMGAWASAWVVGIVTFLKWMESLGWINLKKKK